jgi:hypothetical protein
MPLLQFLVILVAIGVLLWAVTTYIPMDAKIKKILVVVVVIAVVLWCLQLFGVFNLVSGGPTIGTPHGHR